MAEVPHNPYTFGLGYMPTKEDWVRKGKKMVGRAKAKQSGRPYEIVHRPNQGTMNGRFVREGEDFPFCAFPEPCLNSEKRHLPGFEIFFDLQLQEGEATEEQTKLTAEAE